MDAPYTVLARRFRPQTFGDVVGQDRISTTLRHAIRDGRVAHAYLFTGARGVGKTSMARIFAKALNCPNAVDAVPCNACEICQSISAGQDVDVSEIDGASNRGIDDIRALRANVHVRSMRSKYKVYIVDEVHMLTKDAFNALLKTLEEPPPAVKFIFCTTEPGKIPDTILSRCQRFDFGTIEMQKIMGRLHELAVAEGYDVETAALELVARRAAGSMRDSQSLFDQLLAFGEKRITAADVHRLLGTAPDERLIEIAQALLDRRRDAALLLLHTALQSGVQLEPFADQLVSYLRDLLVLAAGAVELPLMSVNEDSRPTLQSQAQAWGLQTLAAALEILGETKIKMQRSTFGRALVELALVRISLLQELDRLDDLIGAIKGAASRGGSTPTGRAAPPVPSSARMIPEAPRRVAVEEPRQPLPATKDQDVAPESPAVSWEPGCEAALLSRLKEHFTDILGTYLAQVTSAAIVGPNQLELSFPASYDISRKACERPEVLTRIESAIKELAGEVVRLRFRLVAGPEASLTKFPPAAANRPQSVESPDDTLVQEVGRVFGIERWQKHEVLRAATLDGAVETET